MNRIVAFAIVLIVSTPYSLAQHAEMADEDQHAEHGGHFLIANNIGAGLAFTLSVEEDYNSNDKLCVEVKLEDILDQNGLIYEVTSVPEYVKAFFFSLPDKKIKVEVYDKNVKR
jgi:hypothetical protein